MHGDGLERECSDILSSSYITKAIRDPGAVAMYAELKKRRIKFSSQLISSAVYILISTCGSRAYGQEAWYFITELGRRDVD